MTSFQTCFLVAVFGVTALRTTDSNVVTSTPIEVSVETVIGASLNEITCQEPNTTSSISEHNTAWVCELVNWRNQLAKSKERIDRNCNTSEVEESWKSLFECPDFSNITCIDDSSRNAVIDFFNCSIVFCADGLYTDQNILLGIWRQHLYNFKKIYTLSKMIQCRLSDCPEPTDFIPDVDECITDVHDCDENATCNNTAGSYICYCLSGFSGNGSLCTDINECTNNDHNCHVNATCTNAAGSYSCQCLSGYTGDGVSCQDINECTNDDHNCHVNAICTNAAGSYSCQCSSGYTGDGFSCQEIDECYTDVHMCHDDASCSNTIGSYVCECLSGFTGNGTICEDIDECASQEHTCHNNATCNNTVGSYKCICSSGYIGDGISCEDIDECRMYVHDCHNNATCNNTAGSYVCQCSPGFTGNGIYCEDIDECVNSYHNCHPNAVCTNTDGSFACQCSSGYTGDRNSCQDIDECVNSDHNCHPNAVCSNSAGSYSCQCSSGYTGDGNSCQDIDECTNNDHICHQNAVCTNTDGSYSCQCLKGYKGDGKNCQGCYSSVFQFSEKDHLHYVRYNGTLPRMTSFTACVWVEPPTGSDRAKGSILSYCVSGTRYCNTIWAKLVDGRVISYLGGVEIVLDNVPVITARSHLCFVMSVPLGSFSYYVNSVNRAVKSNVAVVIEEGGMFLLGQDHDLPEPRDAHDGFYGQMDGFHLWDRALSAQEIAALYESECHCASDAIVIFDTANSIVIGSVTASSRLTEICQ